MSPTPLGIKFSPPMMSLASYGDRPGSFVAWPSSDDFRSNGDFGQTDRVASGRNL